MGVDVRHCKKCLGTGPFGRDKNSKDGLKTYCRKCCAKKQAEYRQRNPDAWSKWASVNSERLKAKGAARYAADPEAGKKRARQWQLANPDKFKNLWARSNLAKYNITPEQKQAIFDAQAGTCAICPQILTSGRMGMQVDHNHSTGVVRGLLCPNCNMTLGDFKESERNLETAVSYLQSGVLDLPPSERPLGASKTGTRVSNLWYSYGLTESTLQWIVDKQGGGCGICQGELGSKNATHIDHDHSKGKKAVRGVLCRSCNLGVGHARESVQILRSAIEYLNRPNETLVSLSSPT